MEYLYSPKHQEQLVVLWQKRLLKDKPQYDADTRQSIIRWLLEGSKPSPDSNQMVIEINRRYQILQQRYLDVQPTQAYTNLIERLNVQTLKQLSSQSVGIERNQQRVFVSLTLSIVQQSLKKREIKEKIATIAKYTEDSRLRNAFFLVELEEYCLKLLHTRPLLFEQFFAHLDAHFPLSLPCPSPSLSSV